jgi:hypothetical protein
MPFASRESRTQILPVYALPTSCTRNGYAAVIEVDGLTTTAEPARSMTPPVIGTKNGADFRPSASRQVTSTTTRTGPQQALLALLTVA